MNRRYYLESGYLNIPKLTEDAIKNDAPVIIVIGARQVGKTYGTLKYMLDRGEKFILMRRTQAEVDFICHGAINPFAAIDSRITIKKQTQYTGAIMRDDETIGMVVALTTVSKIRGFYGGEYKALVYDEFIPESHVNKIRHEGEAFLNALVTISGNRELEGGDPLRVYLLANSNDISSPILQALGVTDKLALMLERGQELSILSDRGLLLFLPESTQIRQRRKKSRLFNISADDQFNRMAYDNEFSYNDTENVQRKSLSEYLPLFSVTGRVSVYKHKSQAHFYVGPARMVGTEYTDTERSISLIRKRYRALFAFYYRGDVYFSTLAVKAAFLQLFGLD
ncbi:MAG: phage DNA encapsidation protein [Ruminococcus sp.]|nr:phage DNA encapsidation protein [Ruminococcus sp.]